MLRVFGRMLRDVESRWKDVERCSELLEGC